MDPYVNVLQNKEQLARVREQWILSENTIRSHLCPAFRLWDLAGLPKKPSQAVDLDKLEKIVGPRCRGG